VVDRGFLEKDTSLRKHLFNVCTCRIFLHYDQTNTWIFFSSLKTTSAFGIDLMKLPDIFLVTKWVKAYGANKINHFFEYDIEHN